MVKNKNPRAQVIYLGENGFPEGFGSMQRLIMLSQALIMAGADVSVINRKGGFDPDAIRTMPLKGEAHGIQYIYTSGNLYRSNSLVTRTWLKIKGIIGEYRELRRLRKSNRSLYVIVSCYPIQHALRYKLWSWWHGVPMLMNYVEKISSLAHRDTLRLRLNDYIYDHYVVSRADAALPISQYLVDEFKDLQPDRPLYKVPIICDFDKFDVPRTTVAQAYFCYCGALDYSEVIQFVLDAYNGLGAEHDAGLMLILGGGSDAELAKLESHITKMHKSNSVTIKRNVAHDHIPPLYKNGLALLIPMRATIQDKARFPHKIGEYVASGNPMITCNYGEVAHYFQDGVNALVTDSYEVKEFTSKLRFILDHPAESKAIGEAGKAVGLANFDYKNIGEGILKFMKTL